MCGPSRAEISYEGNSYAEGSNYDRFIKGVSYGIVDHWDFLRLGEVYLAVRMCSASHFGAEFSRVRNSCDDDSSDTCSTKRVSYCKVDCPALLRDTYLEVCVARKSISQTD